MFLKKYGENGWPQWFLKFLLWNWKTSTINDDVITANSVNPVHLLCLLKSGVMICIPNVCKHPPRHFITSPAEADTVKWKNCHGQSEWVETQPQLPFVSHNRTWELADIWGKPASQNNSFLERLTSKPAGKPFYILLIASTCAWMRAPAFICVHCACVSLYNPPPH